MRQLNKELEAFQLTTSQGGRRAFCHAAGDRSAISTHDLTRRSTKVIVHSFADSFHFNSRPHKEVDVGFHLRQAV